MVSPVFIKRTVVILVLCLLLGKKPFGTQNLRQGSVATGIMGATGWIIAMQKLLEMLNSKPRSQP